MDVSRMARMVVANSQMTKGGAIDDAGTFVGWIRESVSLDLDAFGFDDLERSVDSFVFDCNRELNDMELDRMTAEKVHMSLDRQNGLINLSFDFVLRHCDEEMLERFRTNFWPIDDKR